MLTSFKIIEWARLLQVPLKPNQKCAYEFQDYSLRLRERFPNEKGLGCSSSRLGFQIKDSGCSLTKKSIVSGFIFDFRRSIESCRLARVPCLNSGRKLSLFHFKWYLFGVKYSHAHIGLLPTSITGTAVHRHPSKLTYLRHLKIAKFNPCVSKGWFFSLVFQLLLDYVFETSATFNIPST